MIILVSPQSNSYLHAEEVERTTSLYNFCLLQFVRLIVIAEKVVVHYNVIMYKIAERV